MFISISSFSDVFRALAIIYKQYTDGLLSSYYPDFILRAKYNGENNFKVYLVETKSEKDKNDLNVKQKQKGKL